MNERPRGPRSEADDQQTGRLLGDWLRDEAPTHEPPVTMPSARARIALTRRRPALLIRDWWRWRPGRSDRGFPRMNAVTQLAAVAVLALTGVGIYMVVEEPPAVGPGGPSVLDAPAWTADDVTKVTGWVGGDFDRILEPTQTDLGWVYRDEPASGTYWADDPRLRGEAVLTFDWNDFGSDIGLGAAVVSTSTTVTNDEGAWQGILSGIRYPDEGFGDQHIAGLLTGSGAYEGLTAYLFLTSDGGAHTFEGLIFPGEMPE